MSVGLSNRNFVGIVSLEGPDISMVFLDPKETGESFIINRNLALKYPAVSFIKQPTCRSVHYPVFALVHS